MGCDGDSAVIAFKFSEQVNHVEMAEISGFSIEKLNYCKRQRLRKQAQSGLGLVVDRIIKLYSDYPTFPL